MRYALLLVVSLILPVEAQDAPNRIISGEWVGPLELTIEGKRGPVPTRVALTLTGDAIAGDWRTLPPNTSSGQITGTMRENDIRLTVTFRTGAVDGDPERCIGEASFDGRLTVSDVLRLRARDVNFSLPRVKASGRECANVVRDLIWTLQRR